MAKQVGRESQRPLQWQPVEPLPPAFAMSFHCLLLYQALPAAVYYTTSQLCSCLLHPFHFPCTLTSCLCSKGNNGFSKDLRRKVTHSVPQSSLPQVLELKTRFCPSFFRLMAGSCYHPRNISIKARSRCLIIAAGATNM